ncbi:hypothetical protein [Lysobacter sp. A3-1-A15]|uniref:hypothetical protein n=1 Tax=Novilysobacter viscosus TaxID=3098602 RepID=UPI002ED8D15F
MDLTLVFLTLAVLAGLLLWGLRRRGGRRQQAVRGVLDAADALEHRLRQAREEIEAVAGEHAGDPVRDAMREMLRQRLWLRDHGDNASIAQLDEVRSEIEAARLRIDQQLKRIEQARTSTSAA